MMMKRLITYVFVVLGAMSLQMQAHNALYHNGPGAVLKGEVQPMTPEEQQFTYYLYAAQNALDAGRYDDALALSEFAWRLKPTDPAINFFLGVLYEGMKRPEAALRHYKLAYTGSPQDYWQRYFSLLSRTENKQSQRLAVKVVEDEAKRQPNNTEVLETYQQVLLAEGKFRKAMQVQDKIERIEGKSPYNVLRRYRILLVEGKAKEAVQVIEDYCKAEPDDDYFQAFRGDMYYAMGQKEKALLHYTQAYNRNPENIYLLQSLQRYYKAENAAGEERKILDALIQIAPDEKVLERYFELLSQDSTVSNEEQVQFVHKAYLMEPNSAKWHYYWGLALIQMDSINGALEVVEEGIRLGANQPVERFKMHALSGDLYMRLGQLDSCYSHYERALVLDPENVYILNNYAYTLATHGGDLKKAEKMSQKTIEKEPNNPTYLDTYAWILHLQGQDALAKFYMKRAMEKAGERAEDEELRQHYETLFQVRSSGVQE